MCIRDSTQSHPSMNGLQSQPMNGINQLSPQNINQAIQAIQTAANPNPSIQSQSMISVPNMNPQTTPGMTSQPTKFIQSNIQGPNGNIMQVVQYASSMSEPMLPPNNTQPNLQGPPVSLVNNAGRIMSPPQYAVPASAHTPVPIAHANPILMNGGAASSNSGNSVIVYQTTPPPQTHSMQVGTQLQPAGNQFFPSQYPSNPSTTQGLIATNQLGQPILQANLANVNPNGHIQMNTQVPYAHQMVVAPNQMPAGQPMYYGQPAGIMLQTGVVPNQLINNQMTMAYSPQMITPPEAQVVNPHMASNPSMPNHIVHPGVYPTELSANGLSTPSSTPSLAHSEALLPNDNIQSNVQISHTQLNTTPNNQTNTAKSSNSTSPELGLNNAQPPTAYGCSQHANRSLHIVIPSPKPLNNSQASANSSNPTNSSSLTPNATAPNLGSFSESSNGSTQPPPPLMEHKGNETINRGAVLREQKKWEQAFFEKIKVYKLKSVLKIASEDMDKEDIRMLQRLLHKLLPDDPMEDNGHFGHYTEKMVQKVQREINVHPSGIVDDMTWDCFLVELEKRKMSRSDDKERKAQELAESKKKIKNLQTLESHEAMSKIESQILMELCSSENSKLL
eukprot:TRINITY_DN10699_c0_g1_i3.p1 TRINITY_DN10699_c0_g1~~TRINITY_DN10699_c0_g1_i3.p1  ORF type:complete len:618 (+),score=70.94 TRINITY_DN10699_c0_g1_i3:139-1992(+)